MSRRDTARMSLRRAAAATDPWLLRDDALFCDNRQEELCFLYTMSCKKGFDEKLIECVRSFPVIYDLSKKSYKDKIAKDNAW